jgi:hypothetical protein
MMMRNGSAWLLPLVTLIALATESPSTQGAVAPVNDLPNPYEAVKNWGTLPDGPTF